MLDNTSADTAGHIEVGHDRLDMNTVAVGAVERAAGRPAVAGIVADIEVVDTVVGTAAGLVADTVGIGVVDIGVEQAAGSMVAVREEPSFQWQRRQ